VISFAKAHACGNDFLIVTEEAAAGYDKAELAVRLCERNTGIGADGVEFFAWTGPASGRIRLHNADGSIAEISGNGTRCVAAWMAEEIEAVVGDVLTIETDAGIRTCTLRDVRERDMDGPTWLVTTDMDVPEFEEQSLELADGTAIDGVFVSMGNPHFVILLDSIARDESASENHGALDFSIDERSWQEIGEEICFHPDFPDQTNVEFLRILPTASGALNQVALRIFERGVGPTTSSGTGTSAAATAMIGVYEASSPLEVIAPGGIQTVEWAGEGENLFLTGPATLLCRGEAW
jgi:diaminopimelate epimerase